MSSPMLTKTITITVKGNTELSGSFKIPFSATPAFNIPGKKPFPMQVTPIVTISGDGKQTLSGDLKIDVTGLGTVTYSGDFELNDQGGTGKVRFGAGAGEDDWHSTVTSPIPERGKKSYD